jgi:histidinol-phosphate aminotransferase
VNESATLVYICNPNNPTGTLTQRKELETFIGKLPDHTYVLIDEAYHHFAGVSQSYASFIEKPVDNPRLIVSRTFSKVYGLAGVRVGYAVTTQATRERLAPQHLWGSLNIVAARAASAALEDRDHLRLAIKRNADDRQEFFNQAQLRMLKPLDSHTNFYMMDSGRPARQVIDHFEKHNIRIGREFPPLTNYVRISLGLPSEIEEFWRVWDLMPHVEMKM